MKKRHRIAMLLVTVVSSLAIIASAQSSEQKYVDSMQMSAWRGRFSAYSYWDTNRVWRPIGRTFTLGWRHPEDYSWFAEQRNADQNPFAIWGSYGYVAGMCLNYNDVDVYPVTCKVYDYYS